jgi:DNA repair protein RecO (recombination protein O)
MDFGEADRILTLYTPSHGKIHAIAKGVRRSRSRTAGHLDLFTRCTVFISRGRNLDILTQAQAIEQFAGLRSDLSANGLAHYTAELLDSFAPDHLPNAALYGIQLAVLRHLDAGATALRIRAFEMNLLELSGYRPELHICLGCGKAILPEANCLSVALGGVLCPKCRDQDPSAKPISVNALKLLRILQVSPQSVLGLESVDHRVGREIEGRLHDYIAYRLEKRPKSVGVLERMESRLGAIP